MGSVGAQDRSVGNVVCDLDGVVFRGGRGIPGSGEALHRLTEHGWRILFVTNNSTGTPEATARTIEERSGFAASPDQVLVSSQAAAFLLAETRPRTYVIGSDGIHWALAEAGVPVTESGSDAEAVVVGLDREFDYRRLDEASDAVRRGARFIAANTDVTFPGTEGLHPGAGAIVAAIVAATGEEPEVAGKPHAPIRTMIKSRLGAGPVWVIGDRPETDIALAMAEGWKGALVLTGVIETVSEVDPMYRPEFIADDLAEFTETLLRQR